MSEETLRGQKKETLKNTTEKSLPKLYDKEMLRGKSTLTNVNFVLKNHGKSPQSSLLPRSMHEYSIFQTLPAGLAENASVLRDYIDSKRKHV